LWDQKLLTNQGVLNTLYENLYERYNLITANDLRKGMMIRVDDELFAVFEYQWSKPGKGGAFVKTRLRNIKKNTLVERTFRATEKVEDIYIDKRKMQFLYSDGESSVFMDLETYEQESILNEIIEDQRRFLKEGQEVDVDFYKGEIIGVELPTFVKLAVTHTEPGVKGDTATSSYKPCTLETGTQVHVPLFVNENDTVKIDTRTGEYVERV
jgi:elongation factor P